jgi:hypothetical protein
MSAMGDDETPEKRLLDRVKHHDSQVTAVQMNDHRTIDVAQGEVHTLFTFGLCGCTASLVATKDDVGLTRASLHHFDPLNHSTHAGLLKNAGRKHFEGGRRIVSSAIYVVTPGEWVKKGEKYEQKPKDDQSTNLLTLSAQVSLGDDLQPLVAVLSYSEKKEIGKSSAFIIRWTEAIDASERYEAHGSHHGKLFGE